MNMLFALVLMLPTADARPAWVGAPSGLRDGVYVTQTIVGPESTREECDKQVLSAARSAAEDYAARWSSENGYGPILPLSTALTDEELTQRVIGEKWEEHVKLDGADRIFLHVQLKFDARLQDAWRRWSQQWRSEQRGVRLAFAFMLVMWGVAIFHVGLRLDGMVDRRRARAILWTAAGILIAIPLAVA